MKDARQGAQALAGLVRMEAHHARSVEQMAPDPVRQAAGWERRCVVDGTRVAELTALYAELGFEVAADPVAGSQIGGAECGECQLVAMLKFRMIYTRRKRDT